MLKNVRLYLRDVRLFCRSFQTDWIHRFRTSVSVVNFLGTAESNRQILVQFYRRKPKEKAKKKNDEQKVTHFSFLPVPTTDRVLRISFDWCDRNGTTCRRTWYSCQHESVWCEDRDKVIRQSLNSMLIDEKKIFFSQIFYLNNRWNNERDSVFHQRNPTFEEFENRAEWIEMFLFHLTIWILPSTARYNQYLRHSIQDEVELWSLMVSIRLYLSNCHELLILVYTVCLKNDSFFSAFVHYLDWKLTNFIENQCVVHCNMNVNLFFELVIGYASLKKNHWIDDEQKKKVVSRKFTVKLEQLY